MNRLALVLQIACLLTATAALAQQTQTADANAAQDPLLVSMQTELHRNFGKLKLPDAPAPYYIEYRVLDRQLYSAGSAFGALTSETRVHARVLAVTVRVGSYQRDNSFAQGIGIVDLMPEENDPYALQHTLWLATDRAYKQAVSIFAAKQSMLARFQNVQRVDDFAHEPAVTHITPLAVLDLGTRDWTKEINDLTAMYAQDPQLETFTAKLQIAAANEYFVNSEGTVLRKGRASYSISVDGTTQAPDGMNLSQGYGEITPTLQEFPSEAKMHTKVQELLDHLKQLRSAPSVAEEYDGPVLLWNRAADSAVGKILGENVLGVVPDPGSSARTVGDYANNYKERIMPAFATVVDDPTLKVFKGEGLLSNYAYDDEGVKADKLTVVDKGVLANYLTTRAPILDFPESNGRARAAFSMFGAGVQPTPSTLVVTSSAAKTFSELKQRLIALCKDQGLSYGYLVKEMAPPPSRFSESADESAPDQNYTPSLLYRVYAGDGHEELVRGATLDALDARSLRNNLLAMGDDQFLEGGGSETAPIGLIAPSMLFNNLEIKPSDRGKDKLPMYPPPEVAEK